MIDNCAIGQTKPDSLNPLSIIEGNYLLTYILKTINKSGYFYIICFQSSNKQSHAHDFVFKRKIRIYYVTDCNKIFTD